MTLLLFLSSLLTLSMSLDKPYYGKVSGIPGYNNSNVSYSGYIPVTSEPRSAIYFWFWQSFAVQTENVNPTDIPIIVWFQGGPGTSGMMGNFLELGPYYISKCRDNNNEICMLPNKVSWVQKYHLLLIDQPIGSGYSFVERETQYITSLNQGSENIYDFFQIFFNDLFPQYKSNKLYLFGQAYAGKYITYYASYILNITNNMNNKIPSITGIGIGNGWAVPCVQPITVIDMSKLLGLITQNQSDYLYDIINGPFKTGCEINNATGQMNDIPLAFQSLGSVINYIFQQSGEMNAYNFAVHGEPTVGWNYTLIELYLNNDTIRNKLYANNSKWTYKMNSDQVLIALTYEQMFDSSPQYIELLDKYKIPFLIYQGQNDPIWLNSAQLSWLDGLKWSGQKDWLKSKKSDWTIDGSNVPVGFVRKANALLKWVQVFNAGHSVPLSKPQIALQMVQQFII